MCKLSNGINWTTIVKNEDGTVERVVPDSALKGALKEVSENKEILLEGENGEGGRPRFKEEEKLPPNYAEFDLYNENEPILFEAELMKYKPGYTGTFVSRYIQVTETSLRIYKNRAYALSAGHKPLLAIPVEAFLKVERVNFDLKINGRNEARFAELKQN